MAASRRRSPVVPGALGWTTLGVPDHPARWIVDRHGLLSPEGACWGLDWLVGAPDRWHVPAEEPTVRQRLIDAAPVVETAVRTRTGDVVARCWAEQGRPDPVAHLEVRNTSADAVALALVVLPSTPRGPGRAGMVETRARGLLVDGVEVVVWATPARHGVAEATPCAAGTVVGGRAVEPPEARAKAADGRASAALVWPLGPGEALVVSVPPAGRAARPTPAPAGAPRVAAGWVARVDAALHLELPPGRLAGAIEAVRHRLLLLLPFDAGASRRVEAARVAALAGAGWLDEAAGVLERWLEAPGRDGRLGSGPTDTATTLVALEGWRRLIRRPLPAGAVVVVGRAAEHLFRASRPLRRARRAGIVEPAVDLGELAAGLAAAATLLASAGERTGAAQVGRWMATLPDPDACPAEAPRWPPAPPAAGGGVATLEAVVAAIAALDAGGDPSGPLGWLLEAASPTWTWPSSVGPDGASLAACGDAPDVTAGFWSLARGLLVSESAAGEGETGEERTDGLAVARWMPPEWWGQPLEVHRLPTAAGPLSYALRWHGSRPALLWELAGDGARVSITAPGLDPSWRSAGRRGEALLGVSSPGERGRSGKPPGEGARGG